MNITEKYVEQKFDEYNELMFKGSLPRIPITITNVKGFLGVCKFKTKHGDGDKMVYYDFSISINSRIDLPEVEVEDTIIHEMIHYFIGYNQLEDASTHGPVFQSMMNLINEKFGRHISISHKCTREQEEQSIDTRRRWHVIACVEYDDGRFGIKVLPRVVEHIINFNSKVLELDGVCNVLFYMTDEPYFNRYPTSTAIRIIQLDKSEVDKYLVGAKRLVIDGADVREEL